ncbi:hypothetical protein THF1C08_320059 [Vibrio jasicida]|jgi:hypothetical protein|uniref:Uncharacterized protein n=1 Tax=Vibrio jasicida TaxID=766224 RepID=A0AAU9QRI8_9VIBR|nr:hypothetical protein [Vibrio alginolyticus]CAH1592808.1 hypothetical protein THF1C08_320059 [Vibrio jasicida]CAH1597457.1 hypothetical protein THF1A12_320059 [Vibrio jasicida]
MKLQQYIDQNGGYLIYTTEDNSWRMLIQDFNDTNRHIVEVPFTKFLKSSKFMNALDVDVTEVDLHEKAWASLTYLYNRKHHLDIGKGLIKKLPTYLANTKDDRRTAMVVEVGNKYALVEMFDEIGKVVTYDDLNTLCVIATFGYFTKHLDKDSIAITKLNDTLKQYENGQLKLRDHMKEPQNQILIDSFIDRLKADVTENKHSHLDDFTHWVNSTVLEGEKLTFNLWNELCFKFQTSKSVTN